MRVSSLVLLPLLLGCGARTGPADEVPSSAGDAGDTSLDETIGSDTTGIDTIVPIDTAAETAIDTIVPIDVGRCDTDDDCADLVTCSIDRCEPSGFCSHTSVSGRCDDGRYCNGDEQCDVFRGCVPGVRDCADAVSCTHDVCDEGARRCNHAPDDALCPVSHGCDPTLGCQARALAQTASDLFEIRLPSGTARRIGATRTTLTDIALHPSGTLYGISFSSLSKVDTLTGVATPYASVTVSSFNALDFAPDGTLYGASGNLLYVIDPSSGDARRIASFPGSLASSGDLAFIGSRLVATANTGGGLDTLIEFDVKTGLAKTLGSIGHRCVWGLAAYGPTLYGLTCEGRVLSIDPTSGAGVLLTSVAEAFYGASAR